MKFKLFVPAITMGLFLVAAPAVPQAEQHPGTPVAQAEGKDTEMATKIRQGLADDTSLTPQGKTVTVDVASGKATLTGSVSNDSEKQKIESIAAAVVGQGNVVSKLEVAKQ